MKPPVLDTVFTAAFVIALLLLAAASFSLVYLLSTPPVAAKLSALPTHPWWFEYHQAPAAPREGWLPGAEGVLVAVIAVSLCAIAGGAKARAIYARLSSPVTLFFIVFLLTLCMEGLKGPAGISYAVEAPTSVPAAFSRILWGARFAGELSLLAAAMYALELKYARHMLLAGIILVVAAAIALSIPMDLSAFLASLSYRLGDEQGVWFANGALGILVALSFCGAGFMRGNPGWYVLAGASVTLLLGRELISFSTAPAQLGTGLLLTVVGIIAFLIVLSRSPGHAPSS